MRMDRNKKPIMIVGQDESTYHQFFFSKKQWKGPKGRQMIMPKGDGEMLMVSGYQAREFGLGLGAILTPQLKQEINQKRVGKHYKSVEDALILNSDSLKKTTYR